LHGRATAQLSIAVDGAGSDGVLFEHLCVESSPSDLGPPGLASYRDPFDYNLPGGDSTGFTWDGSVGDGLRSAAPHGPTGGPVLVALAADGWRS